jgi:predicted nucleotidyltransferase
MTTGSIKLPKELEMRIRDALAPLDPEKIILFGSRAWGEPTEDSDIDLYVVTRDDFVPANYQERMQTHLKVSALLREINKSIPIDLIVHTRPMHQAFVRRDSMFAREVMTRGEVLYERDN